jgi:hypothetical protein
MNNFVEQMFWPLIGLGILGLFVVAVGVATWSDGGRSKVRAGLWLCSVTCLFLLHGVVPDSLRLAVVGAGLAVVAAWYFQDMMGWWSTSRPSR